jgi:WD40 repeat protein
MLLLHGHKKAVNALAFSPDGALLASAGSDFVGLWELATGKLRWSVVAEYSQCPVFSPDGRRLAATGLELGYWKAANGKPARKLRPGAGEPICCAFSPDGKWFVGGMDDDADRPRVCRWTVSSWERELFPIVKYPVQACAFHPNSKVLAIAGKSRMALVDIKTGRERVKIETGPRYDSSALGWSPDGELLLHAAGPVLSIRDGKDLSEKTALRQEKRYFLDFAFQPGGRLLATVSKDEHVRLWDTNSWKETRAYTWEIGGLRCVDFSPDGLLAAAAGDKGGIVVWDVED